MQQWEMLKDLSLKVKALANFMTEVKVTTRLHKANSTGTGDGL